MKNIKFLPLRGLPRNLWAESELGPEFILNLRLERRRTSEGDRVPRMLEPRAFDQKLFVLHSIVDLNRRGLSIWQKIRLLVGQSI